MPLGICKKLGFFCTLVGSGPGVDLYNAELKCSPLRPFKAEVIPVEATEDFPTPPRKPGFLIVSVPVVLRVCLLTAVCGAKRSFLGLVTTSLAAAVAVASASLPAFAAAVVLLSLF